MSNGRLRAAVYLMEARRSQAFTYDAPGEDCSAGRERCGWRGRSSAASQRRMLIGLAVLLLAGLSPGRTFAVRSLGGGSPRHAGLTSANYAPFGVSLRYPAAWARLHLNWFGEGQPLRSRWPSMRVTKKSLAWASVLSAGRLDRTSRTPPYQDARAGPGERDNRREGQTRHSRTQPDDSAGL
jgi:hypothetical protein